MITLLTIIIIIGFIIGGFCLMDRLDRYLSHGSAKYDKIRGRKGILCKNGHLQ